MQDRGRGPFEGGCLSDDAFAGGAEHVFVFVPVAHLLGGKVDRLGAGLVTAERFVERSNEVVDVAWSRALVDELVQNVGVPVRVKDAFQNDVVAEVEGVLCGGGDEGGCDRVGSAGVVLAEQNAPQVVLRRARIRGRSDGELPGAVVVFPLPEFPRISTSVGAVILPAQAARCSYAGCD